VTNEHPAYYLTEDGWTEVQLPADDTTAALFHTAATHQDEANWLARIFLQRGRFSSEIHPRATFAQVANAVMRHGARWPLPAEAATEAGIDTVLAGAIEEARLGSPPVFDCKRDSTGDYLTFRCPGCRRVNRHWAGEERLPPGEGDGFRHSHCRCPLTKYGYVLREVPVEGGNNG
jgi:hypothetical protein